MSDKIVSVVDVIVDKRIRADTQQPYLFAYSNDMPGLNVCATDPADLVHDIEVAIEHLYWANHRLSVSVQMAREPLRPVAKNAISMDDVGTRPLRFVWESADAA